MAGPGLRPAAASAARAGREAGAGGGAETCTMIRKNVI
jgi:hypothetical protein